MKTFTPPPSDVVLVNMNIHKLANLSKEEFARKISNIRYLRHDTCGLETYWISSMRDFNNLTILHEVVNKGNFGYSEQFVFAVAMKPKLYEWLKSMDIYTIQKQIVAWVAGMYSYSPENKHVFDKQFYEPIRNEAMLVLNKFYKQSKITDKEFREHYYNVCKQYSGCIPPDFLTPFYNDANNEEWGIGASYNFLTTKAYLNPVDWHRVLNTDSEDNGHRAEACKSLLNKWRHCYNAYGFKGFVYRLYSTTDAKSYIANRRQVSNGVKDMVWRRDMGKCVNCGSKEKLEFDHILPFSKGGKCTYRNLQLLCEKCNRKKYNKLLL